MKEYLDFFGAVPPYDSLSPPDPERLVQDLEVECAARGHALRAQGAPPAPHTWVVRSGSLEVLDGDHVVDVLTTGDTVDGSGTVRPRGQPALPHPPDRALPTGTARPRARGRALGGAAVVVRPDASVAEAARRITEPPRASWSPSPSRSHARG